MRLLELQQLSVNFPSPTALLQAVRNLDLDIARGTITCLVGESGCGKSLTCRAILRLVPEYAILGGKILFEGQDLLTLSEREMRRVRGARIGMIFQEPMTSLNPVLTVGMQTAEPLRLHLGLSKTAAQARVIELFAQVGIPEPENRYHAYPHQLSGGMRQRVMIAMALACGPRLLLADEPTTALDVTIQGQILRLIGQESKLRGLAVLLITHDLGVAAEVADAMGVMYAGMLMEYGLAEDVFANPLHPYTVGLMNSQPGRDAIYLQRLKPIGGVVPTLDKMPGGCPFQPRCERAIPRCATLAPPMCNENGRKVACWLYAGKSGGQAV